jgi:hypothetical protein
MRTRARAGRVEKSRRGAQPPAADDADERPNSTAPQSISARRVTGKPSLIGAALAAARTVVGALARATSNARAPTSSMVYGLLVRTTERAL